MVSKGEKVCPTNILHAACPTRMVLDLIADKWTALIIYLLSSGTKRYGELQREIGGISQKMLTQTLRKLEEDGLVKRTVYPVVPPRTEYELTDLGRTLKEPLGALTSWAIKYLPEVEKARKASARRKAHEPAGLTASA
jgi:DNA-binding HxlR family transcriptional regulator